MLAAPRHFPFQAATPLAAPATPAPAAQPTPDNPLRPRQHHQTTPGNPQLTQTVDRGLERLTKRRVLCADGEEGRRHLLVEGWCRRWRGRWSATSCGSWLSR